MRPPNQALIQRDLVVGFRSTGVGWSRPSIVMLPSCQRRWAGSEAVAFLVLSALAIFLPSDARAGCQSAWVHGENPSSSWTHLAVLDPGRQWSQSDSAPQDTPDRPTPCAGGSCSASREIPITSPEADSTSGRLWGDLPHHFRLRIQSSGSIDSPWNFHGAATFGKPVERPPR